MERLQVRLAEPSEFSSYQGIWQWLRQACAVEVDYKMVYQIVRYELNAKLKVPRPCPHKQAPERSSSLHDLAKFDSRYPLRESLDR
ncbi:MAG: hypothetical protein AAF609_24445 [Cyanobacteria bacterium P01_C01_bin.120]